MRGHIHISFINLDAAVLCVSIFFANVAPIVARHKISKLCRAADLYINTNI